MVATVEAPPAAHGAMFRALVDRLPAPVLLVGTGRRIIYSNPVAQHVVGEQDGTCCDLICGGECLTRAALRSDEGGAVRVAHARGQDWNVTASRLPGMEAVVLHLEGDAGGVSADAPPPLRVRALGRTRLEVGDRPLDGGWLEHRPGQVLKYLVAARGRVVTVDELVDALWPSAGAAATANVRQAVHNLRLRIEPARSRGDSAGYVNSHRGGYSLNTDNVRLDVDDFERFASAGMAAAESGDPEHAASMLSAAAMRYQGDFLQDEPFADWTLAERDRLRSMAAGVLRTLARLELEAGDLRSANERLERLAEIEPLDLATQRELLSVMLRRGRHSDAARRYELIRHRYRRAFGQDPGFGLAELAARR
jgi:DNA-binding SARP family transcriptional activator